MLTKSAAKAFFLGGTVICAAAFVFLTVDTIAQFPDRSHEENMTPEVIHGFEIWTENNCMGCHTLMGEGAYYAPELTQVFRRRGEAWMTEFLKDPQAFYPNRRKMVQYDFYDAKKVGKEEAAKNIADTIAFFNWVGDIDLNGFTGDPNNGPEQDIEKAAAKAAAPTAAASASVDQLATLRSLNAVCAGCHAIGGGALVGPDLAGVANRFDAKYLTKWIQEPSTIKADTTMPNLGLGDAQVKELVDFLLTLK